jgi:hypothetical protein
MMRKAVKILSMVSWVALGVAYACLFVLAYLTAHAVTHLSDGVWEMRAALVMAAGLAVSVVTELIEDELRARLVR